MIHVSNATRVPFQVLATIIVMFMLPFVEAQLASECSGMVLCMILFHDFIR